MDEDEIDDPEAPSSAAIRRPSTRSLILGVVLLLCGGAIGAIITAVAFEQRPAQGMRRPERLPQRIATEMKDKYGLTEEQQQRLQAIFEEHGKKLSEIRSEVQPRVDAEHEALRQGVESVLTTEQAERWRKEYEQMRRLWHPRSGGNPTSGGRHR